MFTSSRWPQIYKLVEYIAFRYRDLKEDRDSAHDDDDDDDDDD